MCPGFVWVGVGVGAGREGRKSVGHCVFVSIKTINDTHINSNPQKRGIRREHISLPIILHILCNLVLYLHNKAGGEGEIPVYS